jgi:hypothetical protein
LEVHSPQSRRYIGAARQELKISEAKATRNRQLHIFSTAIRHLKNRMLTGRFHEIRKEEFEDLFSKKISFIWRKLVRDQLRRVDILDSFDYYDFNYNIDERAQLLRTLILNL